MTGHRNDLLGRLTARLPPSSAKPSERRFGSHCPRLSVEGDGQLDLEIQRAIQLRRTQVEAGHGGGDATGDPMVEVGGLRRCPSATRTPTPRPLTATAAGLGHILRPSIQRHQVLAPLTCTLPVIREHRVHLDPHGRPVDEWHGDTRLQLWGEEAESSLEGATINPVEWPRAQR